MISVGKKSVIGKDELLSITSELDLIYHIFGVKSLPVVIKSPIRRDNNPSLGLYTTDGISVYYTDYATGEYGNLFNLLSKYWGVPISEVYNKAYNMMYSRHKGNVKVSLLGTPKTMSEHRKDIDIKVSIRDWNKDDENYWASYGISIDWLKYASVTPISHKIVTKEGVTKIFKADKLAYVFSEFKEGRATLKIYQPYSKRYKWTNTHDSSVISLWTKIPYKGDKVIICSSLKDALCLWVNTGIPCIALQGEGVRMSNTASYELRNRYKDIFVLFDNDKAGIQGSKALCREHNFRHLELPLLAPGKDVSDIYKNLQSKTKFKKLIKTIFNYEKDYCSKPENSTEHSD